MYAVLGKRGLQITSFVLLLFLIFIIEGAIITRMQSMDMRDPQQRIKYLNELGLEVEADSVVESEIRIPNTFSDVYLKYNEMQQEAGFNLEEYKGLVVTKYTYSVSQQNLTNVYVNILCYKGEVIGGDVSSSQLSGFMIPLKKENIGEIKNGFDKAG